MKIKIITFLMIVVFVNVGVFAQETIIQPNTGITIETGATLDLKGGDLVLKSDASGDASLIDKGAVTHSGSGETRVERYLTEGQWHLVSSPVSNAQAGSFLDDYLQTHSENTNGWSDIAQQNYSMAIAQGYSLWSVEAGPTTEVFSGTSNTGSQSFSFTQTGNGWNLVGNPYPSSLDWDAVTIPTELSGAIWLFDPTIGANGDYAYYINGGGAANTTTQYIPSGQGFFIRSTGGSGTLTFENNDRVHSGQSFYKDAQSELLVLKTTGNSITTQTAIRFNEDATQEADRLYDVYRIISDSPDVPMLFTKAGNQNMAINTLHSINENEIVPVWFRAGTSGKYSINASEIETFDHETPIYLLDLEADYIQNLREKPEYIFDYKSGSDKSFLVYFTEPESSSLTSNTKIYANGNTLNINFPVENLTDPNFNAQITIFDLSGRIVSQTQTTDINTQINLDGSNSIYMVSIISGDEVVTEKVYIQ